LTNNTTQLVIMFPTKPRRTLGKTNNKPKSGAELAREARQKREARERERRHNRGAVAVQKYCRGWLTRRRSRADLRDAWDKKVGDIRKLEALVKRDIPLPLATLLPLLRAFNCFFDPADLGQ
jgi:hypothetical protein